ncbi:MAG TPA: undecaprenyl-diphosphate phosphatase, partial [Terriglobales bacterium]|nr:undecaprenyl-diphosphate phosphatase [Terriglobales bacterium]
MNHYLLSLLLGIVEGLTEFLPVSSTAHLRLSEAFLGVDLSSGYWKMYSIVIQLGAILCLPIYFRARIQEFLSTFPHGREGKHTIWTHPLSLTAVAFVFTAVPALLLTKMIGKNLENVHVMASSLVVGGLIMWIVDVMYGPPRPLPARSLGAAASPGTRVLGYKTEHVEQMTLGQAIWIG